MRKIFVILLVLSLCFTMVLPASAAGSTQGASDAFSIKTVLIAVAIGALLALLIPMSILKGQLKTVRRQNTAANYVRPNSMQLTQKRDIYLYRNVIRTAIPKANNSRK